MVHLRKNLLAVMAVVVVVALVGCANDPIKQTHIYNNVREIYNAGVEAFLVDFKLAPAETKSKWAEHIVPVMLDAEKALDDWGLAIDAGADESLQYRTWIKIKNDLLLVVARYKEDWFSGLAQYE